MFKKAISKFATLLLSCAATTRSAKTKVTIIGTFHGSMKKMKIYTPEKLRELLEGTNPDVVVIEARPQDFAQNTTKNTPWDISEIAIPFALQRNVSIEPFDWWLDDTREKAAKFYDELIKTAEGKKIFDYVEDEWRPFRSQFNDFNDVTPEYVHSVEFARLEIEFRNEVTKLVGEGPQNLMWSERAQKMNENLAKILMLYPGKRMTIVTGAFHRPDIEQFLVTRQDVQIIPLFK
ncbi:hypothetical protein D3C87_1101300 [compost metagenome]